MDKMRLRLLIRRWGLPDTPIIFGIDTQSSPVVSQLLEQVSDIIPLESGEWGLEDYAVELKGTNGIKYECLHFNHITSILKDEDEVIIRPLLTHDVKARKMAGRHQISAGGQHLVDGAVFGRPRLRLADRPAIEIPPRKRRRITFDEAGVDDESLPAWDEETARAPEVDETKQLVLHATFDSEDEDDEDFDPEDVEDEKGSLECESEDFDPGEDSELVTERDLSDVGSLIAEDDALLEMIKDQDTLAKLRSLRLAFPVAPYSILESLLTNAGGDVGKAYETLASGFDAIKPKKFVTNVEEPKRVSPEAKQGKEYSHRGADEESEAKSQCDGNEDKAEEALMHHFDQNGLPSGSILSGQALSHMANLAKFPPARRDIRIIRSTSAGSNKSVRFADDRVTHSLTSSPQTDLQFEDGNDSETSSSGTSDTSDSDASDDGSSDTSSSAASHGDSIAENSDSSSEEGDETPEERTSKHVLEEAAPAENLRLALLKKSELTSETSGSPPGKGKLATKSRNARRRQSNALSRYKHQGILPSNTTIHEFKQLNADDLASQSSAMTALEVLRNFPIQQDTSSVLAQSSDFETRRKELLSSITSGGVEVGPQQPHLVVDLNGKLDALRGSRTNQKASPSIVALEGRNASPIPDPKSEAYTKVEILETTEPSRSKLLMQARQAPATISTPSRKSTLDVSASRRMLFGAMGLKVPKTKQDEDKLRNDVMKGVKPLHSTRCIQYTSESTTDEAVTEDVEAWRARIVYTAVECCHDDIELREPPFPFVQRWDPQQQGGLLPRNKTSKRKKDQRDQSQYYQDDYQVSKKQKRRKGKHSYAEEQEHLDSLYKYEYHDFSLQHLGDQDDAEQPSIAGEINDQMIHEIMETPAWDPQISGDLMELPEDPSILPNLTIGQAKTGMIVAFKQLTLSEATKWQPEISAYRTALVRHVYDDGELSLSLAKRDKLVPEKHYDESGARMYGKFEVPDLEEDDQVNLKASGADEPDLVIAFSDMIEPKIVAPASSPSAEPKSTSESRTLESNDEAVEARFSHVTETPLHSGALQLDPDETIDDPEQQDKENSSVSLKPSTPKVKTQDLDMQCVPDAISPVVTSISENNDRQLEDSAEIMQTDSGLQQLQQNDGYDADVSRLSDYLVEKDSESQDFHQRGRSETMKKKEDVRPSGDSPSQQLLASAINKSSLKEDGSQSEAHEGSPSQVTQLQALGEHHTRVTEDQYDTTGGTHLVEQPAFPQTQQCPTSQQEQFISDPVAMQNTQIGYLADAESRREHFSQDQLEDGQPRENEGEGKSYAQRPASTADDFITLNLTAAQPASRDDLPKLPRSNSCRSSTPNLPPSSKAPVTPRSSQSAGDAAIFEKLLRDMAVTDERRTLFSSSFHGIEATSPTRQCARDSPFKSSVRISTTPRAKQRSEAGLMQTPTRIRTNAQSPRVETSTKSTKEKFLTQGAANSLTTPSSRKTPFKDPAANTSSSWESIDSDDKDVTLGAPSSPKGENIQDSWVTIDTEEESSPVELQARSGAWESSDVLHNESSTGTSSKASLAPSQQIEGVSELDSGYRVKYPEMSIASSFSSHVSDHGRQPDFVCETSTSTGLDGATHGELAREDEKNRAAYLEIPSQADGDEANESGDDTGSDDDLPPLRTFCSQQSVNQLKTAYPKFARGEDAESLDFSDGQSVDENVEAQSSQAGMEASHMLHGTMESGSEEEDSGDSDRNSTPKAPLNARHPSQSQYVVFGRTISQPLGDEGPPILPRRSQTHMQNAPPPTSQFISLLSSDQDSESECSGEDDPGNNGVAQSKTFKTEEGWLPKSDDGTWQRSRGGGLRS